MNQLPVILKQYVTSIFLLTFPFFVSAQTHSHGDKPGVHGMVLFGETQQYVSHLPLFYSPHDYQVILKVELDSVSQEIYLKDRRQYQTELYTIEPDKFILPELLNNVHSFKANIYRGHFERGGDVILQGVNLEVHKVLYFNKLKPVKTQANPYVYLLFGNQQEQFLVHQILNRPEFDEILSVHVVDMITKARLKKDQIVKIPIKSATIQPYPWQINRKYKFGAKEVVALKQIYLEFEDLK
ncbi:hypothetical protein [Chryseobacterium sp. M5A1_1a]